MVTKEKRRKVLEVENEEFEKITQDCVTEENKMKSMLKRRKSTLKGEKGEWKLKIIQRKRKKMTDGMEAAHEEKTKLK